MAAIITRRKWTRQPARFPQIDWGNPLARGLVVAMLPPNTIDCAASLPLTITASTTSGDGLAGQKWIGAQSGNEGIYATTSALTSSQSAGTMFCFAEIFAAETTNSDTFIGIGDAWNSPYHSATISLTGTSLSSTASIYGGGSTYTLYGPSWTLNLPTTYSFSWDPTGIAFWQQGTLAQSASAALTINTQGRTGLLNLPYNPGGANRSQPMYAYVAYFWNRGLSASEHAEIHAAPWQLFRPRARRLYFGTSGGNVWNLSIAEALTIIDAPSAVAAFAPAVAESLGLTDTPSAVMTTSATVAESLTLTDAATAAMITAASVAESLAFADTASASAAFAGTMSESLNVTDVPSATAAFTASIAESLTLADAPSATAVFNVTVAEIVTVVDAPGTGGQSSAVSIGETMGFTDAYSATVVFAANIAESLVLTDAPSATAIWNAVVAESLGIVDLPSATANMNVTITEVIGFTDTQSAATPSTLTSDPRFVASAAGRVFIVEAAGRTFVVRAIGRQFIATVQ